MFWKHINRREILSWTYQLSRSMLQFRYWRNPHDQKGAPVENLSGKRCWKVIRKWVGSKVRSFLHSLRARANAQSPLQAEVQSLLNFRWSKLQINKTAKGYVGALRDRFTLKQDTYTQMDLDIYTWCILHNFVMVSCTYRSNFKITHLA